MKNSTRQFLDDRHPLAYCTNVHAGAGFEQMFENLRQFAPRVKSMRKVTGPMGLGLWFSDRSVQQAIDFKRTSYLRDWLAENSLVPFTANAFPQKDFHEPVVKYAVYEPTWATQARLDYTLAVFELMNLIAPANLELSVSTLPLGWLHGATEPEQQNSFFNACASQLLKVCRWLENLERIQGRLAYLCIEPEPGCLLDSSEDVVRYFDDWLFATAMQSDLVRRYLRICHDVCHSAVMFEPQSIAIAQFRQAGIKIGKVQISSAPEANFNGRSSAAMEDIGRAMRSFIEPRYLHQTTVKRADRIEFYEDLPFAFAQTDSWVGSCWRVHFHLPIFVGNVGLLNTTNREIWQFLDALSDADIPRHFEIETYAWSVLPESLATADLAAGIAREMDWFDQLTVPINR